MESAMNENKNIIENEHDESYTRLTNNVTERLDSLLRIAEDYRYRYDNAKSSLSKEIYKKKLIKAVNQVDLYVNLLEGINNVG